MKRVLSLFLSCIFVLGVCFSTPIVASAAEEEPLVSEEGFEYIKLEDDTYKIVGYSNKEATSITIPQYIGISGESEKVGVGLVSADAFDNCTNLEYVFFSGSTALWDGEFEKNIPVHTASCAVDSLTYTTDDEENPTTIYEVCGCKNNRGRITLVATENATYGDKTTAIKVEKTGKLAGVENSAEGGYTLSYTTDEKTYAEVPTDAGTYTAELEYQGLKVKKPFTILPKTITAKLEVPENGFVYNGEEYKPTVKFTDTAETPVEVELNGEGENADYTVTYSDNVSAGTATATVTLKSNGNYTFGINENEEQVYEKEIKYTIDKAKLIITAQDQTIYVHQFPEGLSYEQTGLAILWDRIELTLNTNFSEDNPKAGTYKINKTGEIIIKNNEKDVTENYDITFIPGVLTVNECQGHTGGTATCVQRAECTICGANYGDYGEHNWGFTADGSVITATCLTEGCIDYNNGYGVKISLKEKESLTYTGDFIENPVVLYFEDEGMVEEPVKENILGVLPKIVYTGNLTEGKIVNVGNYTATVTIDEGQTATLPFKITAKELTDNDVTITGIENSYVHTGEEIKPSVDVSNGNVTLVKDTDYTVEYSKNTDVSTEGNLATVTITFNGNYSGTVEKTFEIVAQHVHSWSFDVVEDENGNKISATCESCPDFTECVTITLEAPEIPDDATSLIYDGSVKEATVTISAENTGITPVIIYTSTTDDVQLVKGKCINAGDYTASITLLGKDENETTVTVSFTIEKATATFTAPTANTELTAYSGKPQPLVTAGTTTGGTMQYKLGETGDWSENIPTGTDATTYKVYYKVVGNENYDGVDYAENNFVEVTIAPKTITATLEEKEFTYDGEEHKQIVKFTDTAESPVEVELNGEGENADYTVEYKREETVTPDFTSIGEIKVIVTLNNKNYTFADDAETTTLTYTITEGVASIENKPTAIPGLVYTGSAQELVTVGTAIGGTMQYSLAEDSGWSENIPTGTDAGTYKVYYKVVGDENHTDSAVGSVEVTIEKATPTIDKFTVALPENLTYDGGAKTATVVVKDGVTGMGDVTVKYYLVVDGVVAEDGSTVAPTNAGTYTVKVDVAEGINYNLKTFESAEWTFTIEKATPTVYNFTVTLPENSTYNDEEKNATVVVNEGVTGMGDVTVKYYLVVDGVVAGDGSTVAPTNAGTYIVKIDVAEGTNYNSETLESAKWTFTIEKATPTIDKFTVALPENLTYDGGAKTATVVVKDGVTGMGDVTVKYYEVLENGETQSLEGAPSEEGTYIVKIDVAEGTNYNSATLESAKWTFTIKEHVHSWQYSASGAVITATCQNNGCNIKTTTVELVAPESLVYDGTEKSVTVKAPHADLLSKYTLSHATGADVGTYTAYLSIGEGDKVVTVQKSFTITPALIVVTKVTAIDRVYDGNLVVSINKTDGIVYTGLIDGDKVGFDLSALTGTLSDANVGSNKTVKVKGSIVLTGKDAKNYDVSTPGVTNVNITPATLTVTPNAKSSEQYYSLPALDYKVTGFIGSDNKFNKAPTLTTNADIKTVGNYTITASGAEASANYTITYAPATLTITEHKNHIVKDGTWKETVHGTCMVAGKEAGTCTLCSGTVTRNSKTDPNNHALITTVTKLQTCTQNGEALVTCANGCKYSLKTAVPADGKNHDFAEDFTVIASTCVAKGSKYKVCQNPGCKVVSEKTEIAINPDAHKNIVTVNAKDATCETKGYTGDKVCNDCKKTTDPGMEINAKGHTESDWIIDKEPTFTEEGAKHTACTVCKKELKKEVIAKRALETPEVKIENVSNGIKVSWSQDEDATGYTVYSSTYNASTKKWSSWKNRGTAAATKSSWTDKTVTEGVTYRYTVRSVNGTNRSSYKATSGLLYVSAPKVTASITSTGLLAKWDKVNNATEYVVYRRALVNGTWSSWVVLGTTKAEKNTWSDTSVQSGVTYRYTVRAIVGKVRSGYNTSSSIIYLAQPVLEISNVSNGIQGKWSPITGATGYTIYRSEYNPSTKKWSKWLTLGTTGATAKTFTDKTVKSGYEYKYTIRAVNGKFRSTYQDSNKLVYLAQPTLKISNVANGIQGSWNQVVGATGYIIYRRELKDGKWSNWTSLGTTKATAKTFTDKTVKSGVTYRYTVRATNGVTRSSFASTGSLVFLSVPTVKISSGIKGVNVSWSKIEGATSYLVYRREVANGKWTSWSVITTVTEPTFIDETAKSGTQYRYTVRAVNGSSKSTYTSTSTLNYLAAPTVKLEKLSDSIKVNWTKVTGVTGYTIYRAELGADGKWSKWVTLGTATDKYSSCKDKTAKAGVTYKYTVRAVNGKVKSAYIDGTQITNQ